MTAAATPYIARHPRCSPTRPLTVRAARMPISRPLMTVPTTRPRSAGLGQVGGERHEQLRRDRGDADGQAGGGQPGEARGGGDPEQGDRDGPEHHEDERPPLQPVAQGHEQEQAEGVADLREHGDRAHAAVGGAEVAAHVRQERLGVVEVGDGQAGADRHRPECPASRSSARPPTPATLPTAPARSGRKAIGPPRHFAFRGPTSPTCRGANSDIFRTPASAAPGRHGPPLRWSPPSPRRIMQGVESYTKEDPEHGTP